LSLTTTLPGALLVCVRACVRARSQILRCFPHNWPTRRSKLHRVQIEGEEGEGEGERDRFREKQATPTCFRARKSWLLSCNIDKTARSIPFSPFFGFARLIFHSASLQRIRRSHRACARRSFSTLRDDFTVACVACC